MTRFASLIVVVLAGLTGALIWRFAPYDWIDYLAPIWLVAVVLAILLVSVLRRLRNDRSGL